MVGTVVPVDWLSGTDDEDVTTDDDSSALSSTDAGTMVVRALRNAGNLIFFMELGKRMYNRLSLCNSATSITRDSVGRWEQGRQSETPGRPVDLANVDGQRECGHK